MLGIENSAPFSGVLRLPAFGLSVPRKRLLIRDVLFVCVSKEGRLAYEYLKGHLQWVHSIGTRPPYGNAGRGVGGGAEGRGGEDGGEGGVGGGSGTARSAAGLGQSTRTRGGSGSGSDATHPLPQHPPSQRVTEPRALGPAPLFLPSWIWGAALPGAGRSNETAKKHKMNRQSNQPKEIALEMRKQTYGDLRD
ncbi:androgen receptor-like [Pongo pygmaeus]|uniref:androgen receptor-like n=1 Tax=Pongo abelii TaxID=9601 RepID=UPI0023E832B3|nr:androgen receptor-like [Pongo abelii]